VSSIIELLLEEGFVTFPENSNLINAERAFFGYRAVAWIREQAIQPKFDLHAYLVALTYYKLGMADLKFEENELLYRYRGARLGGVDGEFYKDNPKVAGKFHRPGEVLNTADTISGPVNSSQPPKGDE